MTQEPMANILRSFPYRLPADLATGDAGLDARLQELDARLAGSAAVRRSTLQEARDFLLEARERALASGRSPAEAADEAVAALGDVGEIAAEQRTRLRGIFWRTALWGGAGWGAFMFVFFLSDRTFGAALSRPTLLMGMAAVCSLGGMAFGGVMGYFAAYLAGPVEPSSAEGRGPEVFSVVAGKEDKRGAWFLVPFHLLVTSLSVSGLFGRGPMASIAPWMLIILCFMGLQAIFGVLNMLRFRARVYADAVVIDGLRGSMRIPREAVMEARDNGLPQRLLSSPYGLSVCVVWQDIDGRVRRTDVPTSLVNGDRLRAWFADAAEVNAATRPVGPR